MRQVLYCKARQLCSLVHVLISKMYTILANIVRHVTFLEPCYRRCSGDNDQGQGRKESLGQHPAEVMGCC